MRLEKICIKEFKKEVYQEYKKLFPSSERKPYRYIKKTFCKGLTDIIGIIEENQMVGFFIVNKIPQNSVICLDYFAIFEQYQSKGYGTKSIQLLKEMYREYDGIFIEIEKVGEGKAEEENKIRKKRAKFYENLGFIKLAFEIKLFTVCYSAYIFPCKEEVSIDKTLQEKIWNIYEIILGKKRAMKNCELIKRRENI